MGVYQFRVRMRRNSIPKMAIANVFSQALDANFQKLSMYCMADVEKLNQHLSEKNSSGLLHLIVLHSFIFLNVYLVRERGVER